MIEYYSSNMEAIYVVSTEEGANLNKYKIGKHTGTKEKLLSRYRTYLVTPVLYFFEHMEDSIDFEKDLKVYLDQYLMMTDKGNKSEWVVVGLEKIISKINKLKEARLNPNGPVADRFTFRKEFLSRTIASKRAERNAPTDVSLGPASKTMMRDDGICTQFVCFGPTGVFFTNCIFENMHNINNIITDRDGIKYYGMLFGIFRSPTEDPLEKERWIRNAIRLTIYIAIETTFNKLQASFRIMSFIDSKMQALIQEKFDQIDKADQTVSSAKTELVELIMSILYNYESVFNHARPDTIKMLVEPCKPTAKNIRDARMRFQSIVCDNN